MDFGVPSLCGSRENPCRIVTRQMTGMRREGVCCATGRVSLPYVRNYMVQYLDFSMRTVICFSASRLGSRADWWRQWWVCSGQVILHDGMLGSYIVLGWDFALS